MVDAIFIILGGIMLFLFGYCWGVYWERKTISKIIEESEVRLDK